MPKISVVVPVYNVEKYLHRCIDSILAQTFNSFEIILIDDGSPDNCGKICDEYSEKDNRIHVIHKENGGLSSARNAGIDWVFENSESEWITFIDSDDWISTRYLERLYNAALKSNTKICICYYSPVSSEKAVPDVIDESIEVLSTEQFFESYYSSGLSIISCAKLYNKLCFINIRFPSGRWFEDLYVTHQVLFREKYVSIVKTPLYYYYCVNDESITHKPFSIKKYDDIHGYEDRLNFFNENNMLRLSKLSLEKIMLKKAQYSLEARKAGIYRNVEKKYRISRLKAIIYLNRYLEQNEYEAYVSRFYPRFIKIQAYFRKIEKILKWRIVK